MQWIWVVCRCRTDAFEALDDKPIANELHIYTW